MASEFTDGGRVPKELKPDYSRKEQIELIVGNIADQLKVHEEAKEPSIAELISNRKAQKESGDDMSKSLKEGDKERFHSEPESVEVRFEDYPDWSIAKLANNPNKDQPDPVKNDNPAVWSLVIKDMADRDILGTERYGVRLQADNGRDTLLDAYQEALDLAVYLRAALYERDRK